MSRTRIKICGIRDAYAALAAVDAGADALGFVFAKGSVRTIEPEEAYAIVSGLPPLISSVGVFMNHSVDAFCDIEEQCPTTLSQLHGNEPEQVVRQCGPGLIKAVKFDPATIRVDLARWNALEEVDAILVDGGAGDGEPFDWASLALAAEDITKPIILAGGLSPQNVADAIRAVRPYAVDVSSGVERDRGVKDPALIEAFCEAVRSADRG